MSEQGINLPYAQTCDRRHVQMDKASSHVKTPCSDCKGELGEEESKSNAMEVESSMYTDFISCDRAGRRNAVHDIHQDATTVSVRKLTSDLGDLAVEGAESQSDATSSENDPGARPEGQENSPSP